MLYIKTNTIAGILIFESHGSVFVNGKKNKQGQFLSGFVFEDLKHSVSLQFISSILNIHY